MKIKTVIAVLAVAVLAVWVLVLYGLLVGTEPVDAAPGEGKVEAPCEFERGKNFCVTSEGDVYYKFVGCMDASGWGYCTDIPSGKVDEGDTLPDDVCGDGTYRATCGNKKLVEEKQYRELFKIG